MNIWGRLGSKSKLWKTDENGKTRLKNAIMI